MKKRITKKKIKEFLERIAYIGPSDILGDDEGIYYSKIDKSYLTRVGMEDNIKYLLKHGITEEIQNYHNEPGCSASIGFNPEEQKWYGWSYRALYGFTIGSEVKKGNCAYQAPNKEDFIEDYLRSWSCEEYLYMIAKEDIQEGIKGVRITWLYSHTVPNESIRGTWGERFIPFPLTWGRGEWVASNLEDAKEMACDFAEGVS